MEDSFDDRLITSITVQGDIESHFNVPRISMKIEYSSAVYSSLHPLKRGSLISAQRSAIS